MMDTVNPTTKFVQVSDVFSSSIDDEVVMANMMTDKYYGLDHISSRIWQLLEEPRSLSEVCQALMEKFDVDEATCHQEVGVFLQSLVDAKVVAEAKS